MSEGDRFLINVRDYFTIPKRLTISKMRQAANMDLPRNYTRVDYKAFILDQLLKRDGTIEFETRGLPEIQKRKKPLKVPTMAIKYFETITNSLLAFDPEKDDTRDFNDEMRDMSKDMQIWEFSKYFFVDGKFTDFFYKKIKGKCSSKGWNMRYIDPHKSRWNYLYNHRNKLCTFFVLEDEKYLMDILIRPPRSSNFQDRIVMLWNVRKRK